MTKKPAKRHVILDGGTYPDDTLLAVGMSRKEVAAVVRSVGGAKAARLADEYEKCVGHHETDVEEGGSATAHVYCFEGMTIMSFRKWDGSWDDWGTLVHETAHLVQMLLVEGRGMHQEVEAQAYHQQYLFQAAGAWLGGAVDPGRCRAHPVPKVKAAKPPKPKKPTKKK